MRTYNAAPGVFLLILCLPACGGETPASPDDAGHAFDTARPDLGTDAPTEVTEGDYTWVLPPGFAKPVVPATNPMSKAKVELGRHLFYDKRLSGNQTQSCAGCHDQAKAFTDGRALAVGSTGAVHPRNSMSLVNLAYFSVYTWGNPLINTLEQQALLPMFGESPVELGLSGKEGELLARLRAEPRYAPLFAAAFPGVADPFTLGSITKALASFQRSIVSGRSAYDRWYFAGDDAALSPSAQRGFALFFGERLECFHCHGTFAFADSIVYEKKFAEVMFHNTALYDLDGKGAYPAGNGGTFEITHVPSDMGRFRAPSLRNVAVTAPYMHDGSIATLPEVIDHYANGGRASSNPRKSELIRRFDITAEEKADVVHFLESLTDEPLLTDPRWSDPWK